MEIESMLNDTLNNYGKFVSTTFVDFAPKYMAVDVNGKTYYTETTEEVLLKEGYLPVVDNKPTDGKNYSTTYKLSEDGKSIEVVYTEFELSEVDKLNVEKYEIWSWLSAHDYIGTKISTGRATVNDYKDEVEEMKAKAIRLDEINEKLKNI